MLWCSQFLVALWQQDSQTAEVRTPVPRDLGNTSSENILSCQDEAPKTSQRCYTEHRVTAKLLPA